MITITLWQPWASAMFIARPDDVARMLKQFETRGWAPTLKTLKPGDRLAIHASKTQRNPKTGEPLRLWWQNRVRNTVYASAFAAAGFHDWSDLPFGKVIGYGTFVVATRTEDLLATKAVDVVEQHWGNYSPRRFGWQMKEPTLLSTPIPCRGHQSLFSADVPLVAAA